jgi:hypothetical protein
MDEATYAMLPATVKQTMQMDVLRCKTPAMVRKEIWGHLLVYNLLRAAMAQAALQHEALPRQLSLQGARQTLEAFRNQVKWYEKFTLHLREPHIRLLHNTAFLYFFFDN